ncbi:antitoxin Xre/MbcA/ParS toxin-binding domain-containing protein [Roseomonas sp. GCM10028921]
MAARVVTPESIAAAKAAVDWERVRSMTEEEIERAIAADPDAGGPWTDEEITAARVRWVGITRLVGQVEAMVQESGDPAGFNATEWLSHWLNQPVPALGNTRPIEFMDTMEGQKLVSTVLARMQTGAFS